MGKGKPAPISPIRRDACGKRLPFRSGDEPANPDRFPKSLKAKHRSWLLAGLKAMKAPIAAWCF